MCTSASLDRLDIHRETSNVNVMMMTRKMGCSVSWHEVTPSGIAYLVTCTRDQHDDGVHVAEDDTDSPSISVEGVEQWTLMDAPPA